jgi:predicted metal-dependent hydrolase
MNTVIKLDDLEAEVAHKRIRNIHLRVIPPDGKVRISAPFRTKKEVIYKFAYSKLDWIKKQRIRISNNIHESFQYINQETHYFRGRKYQLKVQEKKERPFVQLLNDEIVLQVPEGADMETRRVALQNWYYVQLEILIPPLITKWESILNVSVERFSIRSMKTRWGSCTPKTRSIRINLELIKMPPECLEYIVVHELVHLLEASHNNKFKTLMDKFYPKWKFYRKELRRLPIKA